MIHRTRKMRPSDGQDQNQQQDQRDQSDETPVFERRASAAHGLAVDLHVPGVRLVGHVEEIADDRNGTHQRVNAKVSNHSQDRGTMNAGLHRAHHDPIAHHAV